MPTGQLRGRWLGLLAGLACASALAQGANRLEDIQVRALSNDQLQVELRLSDSAPEPLSFTIDNPARISLDLPDTTLALEERRMDVRQGVLGSIMTAEAGGRTRVVLSLDQMVPYQTRVQGNSVIVTLGSGPGAAAAAPAPSRTAQAPRAGRPAASSLRDIDFRRGENGAGRVIVRLSDPSAKVDIREEAGRTVVEFRNTSLPDELMKRLDVTDFATPVTTVDLVRVGDNARLVITAIGDYEQLAYQSDDMFTVEVKEVEKRPVSLDPFDEQKEYTGQRLTLNFQDIETRAVLQLLADVSGQNIVVSDTVRGNVTLRLRNVPWDQALDIVLQTKGLDMRQKNNVILVAPAEEIAARERQQLAARKEIQELAPLRTEFMQVNYAKASGLAELIRSSGGGNRSLLSERGSVTIDERTNTLLVQDTAEQLAEIRRLVARLDIPVRQVLIESRIVIVNDDFSRELGTRFGVTYFTDDVDDGLAVSGGATAADTVVQTGDVTSAPLGDRFNINLPVVSPAGRIATAVLGSNFLVDLELSALQAEGRGEIISTPRVITANQKEASIEQGVEIPFQESASSGATTTQFKKAVLSLRVTPQITPDNRIIMDLAVNSDSVGEQVPSATGGFVPSIDTREVITQVLVNDGETVVLGGIYETERREVATKVPFLGDIPGLGYLFRSTQRESNKAELLIFVTPRILREGVKVY